MIAEIFDIAAPLGGVLLGFIFGRRERNLRTPVVYRCDCGHALSMHHPGDSRKGRLSTSCMKCDCRQYIGQRPVELGS